jgi:hypothetical protein
MVKSVSVHERWLVQTVGWFQERLWDRHSPNRRQHGSRWRTLIARLRILKTGDPHGSEDGRREAAHDFDQAALGDTGEHDVQQPWHKGVPCMDDGPGGQGSTLPSGERKCTHTAGKL